MIKNNRQYRITKAQLAKFEEAQKSILVKSNGTNLHPLLIKAQRDALKSQADELREQVEEYEALRAGQRQVLHVDSFDQLPLALIQARVASGLSQKELGEKLGVPEQQVQRYEATNYASASLTRLQEVIEALRVKVLQEIYLPDAPVSQERLFRNLDQIGLPRDFVMTRLLAPPLAERFQTAGTSQENQQVTLQVASTVGRILGMPSSALFSSTPPSLDRALAGAMRFKLKAGTNSQRLNAYAFYAHHLAALLAETVTELPFRDVPTDPAVARSDILARYGKLTFMTALQYSWDLGIAVLPLQDAGAFHGALIRIASRNIIVLKQRTLSEAHWLFDLLHEFRHAGEEPGEPELMIIEGDETSPERRESKEEKIASRFAGDVILNGQADSLAKLCAARADKKIERLKTIVPQVAEEAGVATDALANYMAFRLSLEGQNWWGTANNLQSREADPWGIARDYLLRRVHLDRLNIADRSILQQALTTRSEEPRL
jgi:transcriptional regulator with XRE-family HTH domain/Zn-dependent peptidase ImmA (M78 family)